MEARGRGLRRRRSREGRGTFFLYPLGLVVRGRGGAKKIRVVRGPSCLYFAVLGAGAGGGGAPIHLWKLNTTKR